MKAHHVYYLMTSARSFAIYMVFTLSTLYYVVEAGLNPLQLVLIGTIMELAVLFFEIPTGLIADYFGRKVSVLIGTFLIGSAHLLEGFVPEFWAIAVGAAIWGIGWTFISGAETAWIADEVGNNHLDKVLIKGAKFSSIGSFLGIIVSVICALAFSVQWMIILAGCLLLLLVVAAQLWMKETKFVSIARENTSSIHQMKTALTSSLSVINGNRMLINLAFVTIFMGLASEGFDRLWGAHLLEGFALDEQTAIYWFGVLFAGSFLLNIGLISFVEKYVQHHMSTLLVVLNSLLVVAMIGFALAHEFILAACLYWVVAALRDVNYPLISIMTNKQLESQGRATTLSMFGQLDAFGQIAGGPIVGIIALYTSIQGGLVGTALLIFPTIYFLWRLSVKSST